MFPSVYISIYMYIVYRYMLFAYIDLSIVCSVVVRTVNGRVLVVGGPRRLYRNKCVSGLGNVGPASTGPTNNNPLPENPVSGHGRWGQDNNTIYGSRIATRREREKILVVAL